MTVLAAIGGAMDAAFDRAQGLDTRFLVPALGLQLATLGFRAFAWRNVLAAAYPDRRVPVFGVACAYASGVALNGFLPARGGEGAKVALVRARIPGSSIPTIAASLSVIFLLDAMIGASLVGVLWATGVLPSFPLPSLPSARFAPLGLAVAAAVALALAVAVRRFSAGVARVAKSAFRGLAVLRSPGRYVRTVLPFQLGAWTCRISVVYLLLHAFQIHADLSTAALLVVLNGASTAVPVPGGAGSQQAFAAYALHGTVSTAGAVSFSVGTQMGITVVNTAVGIAGAMLLFRTLRPFAAVRAARAKTP